MTAQELIQWKDIYERQVNTVYQTAFLYFRNKADAEDVVQSVFLKQMEKARIFPDIKQERAWFITVTRNYCKDILKSYWRKKVTLEEVPELPVQENEDSELLQLILQLPMKYREVLYLFYYEEYSIREIAVIVKARESTVGSRLAAAREKLKMIIEKEGLNYGR